MGYVLPIIPHQYNDYQNRIIKEKRNPYQIEKPYKAFLDLRNQDYNKAKNQKLYHNIKSIHDMEDVYATLTGRGQMINEEI